jgi:hypothetical protein
MSSLRDLTPIFYDYETTKTKTVTLQKMSLRRYLAAARVTSLFVAVGGEQPWRCDDPTILPWGEAGAGAVFVAHNDAFDKRVAHYKQGCPWPVNALCTMELAQAAWPNMPGGYSLANLSELLPGMPRKLEIDLENCTPAELDAYCQRDVECCRRIYQLALARLPDTELEIAALTDRTRELSLNIDKAKGEKALSAIVESVELNAVTAACMLDLDDEDVALCFGLDGGRVKSVKPAALKQKLIEVLGFETQTISEKKINPEKLRRNPAATATVSAVSRANSELSHQRRVGALLLDSQMDLNLLSFGSHTGRWTSPATGQGVNFMNLPKRNPVMAKAIRGMLSVDGHVLVRGDMASLEYRIVNLWCRSGYTDQLYSGDIFADAYLAFGEKMTGKMYDKKHPFRQVFKSSVLGLGFLMRVRRFSLELARLLATAAATAKATGEKPEITSDDLRDLCRTMKWSFPNDTYCRRVRSELLLPDEIVTVAFHAHRIFHEVHPELRIRAGWFTELLIDVARSPNPQDVIDWYWRDTRRCPDPELVEVTFDPSIQGRSLIMRCGHWTPTLVWRDLGVRRDKYGKFGLCNLLAGRKGYRQLTENVVMENVTQAMGRNAVAMGMLAMQDSYPRVLNVHDEVLLPVAPDCAAVDAARQALVDTYGPGGVTSCYKWAAVMDPREVNVSRSLYEVDWQKIDPAFWQRIRAGDKTVLDLLP